MRWRNRRQEALLFGPATLYAGRAGGYTARHERDYPGWSCTICGREWPCPPARVQLVEEHIGSRISLGTLMSVQLGEAVQDMPHVGPAELFDRFLAWTRP